MGKRILFVALGLASLAFGYWLMTLGFQSLTQFRQVERLPQIPVAAVLPGEVNLDGTAWPVTSEQLIAAPDTQTPTLYYRYLVEREVRDSEGRTSWSTVSNRVYSVPFLLQDASGRILVDAAGHSASLPLSHRVRVGDMRYSEYRIDPGQSLFLLGYAQETAAGMKVVFNVPGSYTPFISAFGESHERSQIAFYSLLQIIAGLGAAALAVYLLCLALQIHKTVVFLGFMSMTIMLLLVYQGLNMARDDVQDAVDRLHRVVHQGQIAIAEALEEAGLGWSGQWQELPSLEQMATLSAAQQERVQGVRQYLLLSAERTERLLTNWPERLFALDVALPALAITDAEQVALQQVSSAFESTRLKTWQAAVFVGFGALALWLGLVYGFKFVKLKRLIENIPTSPLNGVAYGLSEVVGKAALPENQSLLAGPLTERPCLTYLYQVQERRGSGKNAKWVTIKTDNQWQPFNLVHEDSTHTSAGSIEIVPQHSDLILRESEVRTEGKLRYTERVIEPDTTMYVLGPALVAPERAELHVRASDHDEDPFIISDLTEREVMLYKVRRGFILLAVGMVGGLAMALGLAGQTGSFGVLPWLLCAGIPLLYQLLALSVLMYNDLVFLRQRCFKALANIEVALKKRSDLIPRLEQIAKAYLQHEEQLLSVITTLRQQLDKRDWTAADSSHYLHTERQLHETLAVRMEAYPDLKADETMRHLMSSLTQMEDEVSLMRIGHTLAVERYNTRRLQLPEVVLALLFGFRRLPTMP
ncbi:LemA family protein [Salinispirillum sp. LH 10-3-1]|uniref:RING-type E3 ubiquitin transferase n=1 Tax=Salinispirillum sp. LH 10-3-1 TaxID=2952525 RepID=A0AB38YEX5_9GAMM